MRHWEMSQCDGNPQNVLRNLLAYYAFALLFCVLLGFHTEPNIDTASLVRPYVPFTCRNLTRYSSVQVYNAAASERRICHHHRTSLTSAFVDPLNKVLYDVSISSCVL